MVSLACAASSLTAASEPLRWPGLQEDDDSRPDSRFPAWEGAIGLVVRDAAAYPGSGSRRTSAHPGGFLRWGRYTLTGAGGFTTRRSLDSEQGFGAEVRRTDGLIVGLRLRHDGGRDEDSSPELSGLGDIRPTVRARLSLRWEPVPGWVLTGASSADLLGRVGGYGLDAGLSREWELGYGRRLALSVGLSGAQAAYMQAWHGVTEQQAARSGYSEYHARGGLRGSYAAASYRHELGNKWSMFVEAQTSRLQGAAARSPLTRRPGSQEVGAGLARRF